MRKVKTVRRILFIWVMCAFITAPAWADLISFVDEHPLVGVDGSPFDYDGDPAVDWSIGEDTVNLDQQSYSLLGGMATVSTFSNYPGAVPTLSHRLTRGLGVYASELDEVDRVNSIEQIHITFGTIPYYVHEIEVRSLFDPDTDNNEEWAAIAFWKDGIQVRTEYLLGTEQLGVGGNDGNASWSDTPIIVDKLVFYVPTKGELPDKMFDLGDTTYDPLLSEFAVAKLTVTITPVPSSVLLGILGLGVTGLKLRRFT